MTNRTGHIGDTFRTGGGIDALEVVFGYKILNRYKEHGLEALSDRSRRPWRYANQFPAQVETRMRERPTRSRLRTHKLDSLSVRTVIQAPKLRELARWNCSG